MSLFRLSSLIAAAALLGACSNPTWSDNAIEVSVSGESFQRIGSPAAATVPFTVENRSSGSIFVGRCDEAVMTGLDRLDGENWVEYSGDLCLAIYPMDPMEIAPGSSRAASRAVLEAGTYRIRISAALARSAVLDHAIVSNQFEVR